LARSVGKRLSFQQRRDFGCRSRKWCLVARPEVKQDDRDVGVINNAVLVEV
jgi:hypothetical protein